MRSVGAHKAPARGVETSAGRGPPKAHARVDRFGRSGPCRVKRLSAVNASTTRSAEDAVTKSRDALTAYTGESAAYLRMVEEAYHPQAPLRGTAIIMAEKAPQTHVPRRLHAMRQ